MYGVADVLTVLTDITAVAAPGIHGMFIWNGICVFTSYLTLLFISLPQQASYVIVLVELA